MRGKFPREKSLRHFYPELHPSNFGAPWVSNGIKTKIVVPRGPHQRPEVPQASSKFDLAGKFCKSREMRCFGGRLALRRQMHIHATWARSARESLSGANKLAKDTRGQPLRVRVRRQIGARGLLRGRSWKTKPSLKRKNEWRDFHAFAPFF